MARVPAVAAWLALALVASAREPAPIQVAFTTDFADVMGCGRLRVCGAQGPDGPWQAVSVLAGMNGPDRAGLAVYPNVGDNIRIAGSNYIPSNSTTAKKVGTGDDFDGNGNMIKTLGYYESFGIEIVDQVSYSDVQVNVTYWDGNDLAGSLPNGSTFLPAVGTFGFGPSYPGSSPGPLTQLQSQGSIPSQFFGLHMGSVPLNLSGSLILGGYEKNRALGRVAVTEGVTDLGFYLVDMLLGVEQGGSPFGNNTTLTKNGSKSLWKATWGREAESNTTHYNGPEGSAFVTIDPYYPYMYLGFEACETIASHIPVTWRSDIQYYVWNVKDPLYHRLVSSPAYLALTFADRDAHNLTVKVPFALLNLTLEPPIVPAPTPYFPCQPPQKTRLSSANGWVLGRGFLQAAFFGLRGNPDGSVTNFLAQAPGPGLEQSVIQPFKPNDTTISTNPADSFAKTWQAHWTAIPEDDAGKQPAPTAESSRSNMSGGTVAGIAVGSISGALLVMTAVVLLWKRRGLLWQQAAKDEKSNPALDGRELHEAAASHPPQELSTETQRLEVQGCMPLAELPAEEATSPP